MPEITESSPFEQLQDLLRKEHNKLVQLWFSDITDNPDDPAHLGRVQLKNICTMQDIDTAEMTTLRAIFFQFYIGNFRTGLGRVYGMPQERIEELVDEHPQVFCYFSQDDASVVEGVPRVDAEYSFRLMNELPATITPQKAVALAHKIKQQFVSDSQGIVFTKGKNIYKYYDTQHGYRLRVYGNNEADATDIVKRLLECQNISFDEDILTISTPKKNSVNTPTGTQTVYSRQRKKARFRPVANVRFRYAYLFIKGLGYPVYLVDTTGKYYDALV